MKISLRDIGLILAASFAGASLFLVWFLKKKKKKEHTADAAKTKDPGNVLRRWKVLAVSWPLLCIGFAGIIIYQSVIYQSVPGMEERIFDAFFTLIPLVFFGIGMAMRRRLLKERRYATAFATAVVVTIERHMAAGDGHRMVYFPEFEFQVGEKTYHVKSKSGYSYCAVSQGRNVDLYYAPENPELFYVPLMQKHDRRWSSLLCGVGILWPLIGLFAPQLRLIAAALGLPS